MYKNVLFLQPCDDFPQFKVTRLPKAGFPKVLFESTTTSFPLGFFLLSLDRRASPLWVPLDGGWWKDATRMRTVGRGGAAQAQQTGQVSKRPRTNPRNLLQNKSRKRSPAGENSFDVRHEGGSQSYHPEKVFIIILEFG